MPCTPLQRHKLMRKREKEDERARLEAKRLKEVQLHEERRQKEKEREEKKAVKELHRPRICGKCGQVFARARSTPPSPSCTSPLTLTHAWELRANAHASVGGLASCLRA